MFCCFSLVLAYASDRGSFFFSPCSNDYFDCAPCLIVMDVCHATCPYKVCLCVCAQNARLTDHIDENNSNNQNIVYIYTANDDGDDDDGAASDAPHRHCRSSSFLTHNIV